MKKFVIASLVVLICGLTIASGMVATAVQTRLNERTVAYKELKHQIDDLKVTLEKRQHLINDLAVATKKRGESLDKLHCVLSEDKRP